MKGVIAAGSTLAADAGAAMFEKGGNAVDACVAAAWVSFIAEMSLVNIAGGGYATVWSDGSPGQPVFYDFFCTMPSGAKPEGKDFRCIEVDFGTEKQPFYIGRASSAVPGVVAGLCRLSERYGDLDLAQVMAPAIELAGNGFPVSSHMADVLHLLRPIFGDTPQLKSTFAPGDRFIGAGEHVVFPQLAKTLERLADNGAGDFYNGPLAASIARDHAAHGGLILAEDLAAFQVSEFSPDRVNYRDGEVLLPPRPSMGGPLIGFTLALLQTLPLSRYELGSKAHLRAWAHALRLTSEARAEGAVNLDREEGLAKYQKRLEQALAGMDAFGKSREPRSPSHTSHISAMDDSGLTIALTTSAGESAGYLIDGTGLLMNNILGELDLNPNGFHQHPAGSRLKSMMSPVLYCRGGKPLLSLGSAGSNRLRSAIVQTLSYVVDFGLDLERAANAPRLHYEDGTLQVEAGFRDESVQALEDEGFRVKRWGSTNLFFGGAQVVAKLDGHFQGGADHRRGGHSRVIGDP